MIFEIARARQARREPALFKARPVRDVVEGEIILRQREPSDDLFSIIEGRYHIVRKRQVATTLTPEDIFLGEVSLLLNERHCADEVAASSGRLMEIPRRKFMASLKNSPRYTLLLTKLMATRLAGTQGLVDGRS